jgi:hypothetical protein
MGYLTDYFLAYDFINVVKFFWLRWHFFEALNLRFETSLVLIVCQDFGKLLSVHEHRVVLNTKVLDCRVWNIDVNVPFDDDIKCKASLSIVNND